MNKKNNNIRFEVVFKGDSEFQAGGIFQILVDHETGVNYLLARLGTGVALTPLLDENGEVVINKYKN